jgi:hypothetical protein
MTIFNFLITYKFGMIDRKVKLIFQCALNIISFHVIITILKPAVQ